MCVKNKLILVPLVLLSACGWVDNTGRESNAAPITQISLADGQQIDASALPEQSSITLSVNGSDADGVVNILNWRSEPVEQGALQQCASVPDFDIDLAADSLTDACSENAICRVTIEAQNNADAGNDFLVTAPKLKAPVGVTYELTATDNEGGTGTQRATFCLIAINEAPEVNDDNFTVLEGTRLSVTVDQVNLLTNDKEHEHVANTGLRVLTEPVVPPKLAEALVLGDDGSFTYDAAMLLDRSAEYADDTFVYAVTSEAYAKTTGTVTIRIVAKNDAPEQVTEIELQSPIAGVPFESDIRDYFQDPEEATLNFSIVGGSLPASGGLTLSAAGVLAGTANVFDEGSYPLVISVSDGSESIQANLTIEVGENLPVQAVSIDSQTVELGDAFTLDVSDHFDDPEKQELDYTVDANYADATFVMDSSTGVLNGSFTDDGQYTVDVSADDGVTTPSSIRFVVLVTDNNVAPIFRGRIANQTIELGEPIDPVVGAFSDANNDELSFSVIGTVPVGLTLSDKGVLSGTPTRAGLYSGIRLVASDPFDQFARSNAFDLRVLDALNPPVVATPANAAPQFVANTVFNQGIALGSAVTPVEPVFTDADNDTLRYSVIGGTLPIGVVINPATGAVSGTPLGRLWARGLRVLATDPFGASASSDAFWIRVR